MISIHSAKLNSFHRPPHSPVSARDGWRYQYSHRHLPILIVIKARCQPAKLTCKVILHICNDVLHIYIATR